MLSIWTLIHYRLYQNILVVACEHKDTTFPFYLLLITNWCNVVVQKQVFIDIKYIFIQALCVSQTYTKYYVSFFSQLLRKINPLWGPTKHMCICIQHCFQSEFSQSTLLHTNTKYYFLFLCIVSKKDFIVTAQNRYIFIHLSIAKRVLIWNNEVMVDWNMKYFNYGLLQNMNYLLDWNISNYKRFVYQR